MPFDPDKHHRKSLRVPGADYGMGCYFVTICCVQKLPLLGKIINQKCILSRIGEIAEDCLIALPAHLPHVQIDAYIVMPNHIHVIFLLGQFSANLPETRSFRAPTPGTLGAVVGSYKSAVTKKVNQEVGEQGQSIWQRSYYEKIIRKPEAYEGIREYIYLNPSRWADDEENPSWKPSPKANSD